jgi:hypothetical protein
LSLITLAQLDHGDQKEQVYLPPYLACSGHEGRQRGGFTKHLIV